MMRLVVFADLHLDSAFAWMGNVRGAADRRRRALRDTLERIAQLAVEVQADALLSAGDLYEQEHFTPDTAAFVAKLFNDLPMRVLLAPGNHDWYGPGSLYRRASWGSNVHVFASDRLEPVTLADGLTLWGGAHCAPAGTPGFLDSFRVDRSGIHLGLFHGSVRTWIADEGSGKLPHAPLSAEQIAAAGLHFAFLGHYHRPRLADRFIYPGNPDPLSFGEDGDRGAVVVDIHEDGTVAAEWRRVAVTTVHEVTVDLTGCTSQQEARSRIAEQLAGRHGVARVTLTGELHPDASLRLEDLNGIPCSLDAYRLQTDGLTVGYRIDEIKDELTVRGQFVRDVLSAPDLTDDERRRVLITGLRALDGRNDLEVL